MRILHVEDNQEISQVFADILSTKNYDFDSISDGRAGLELAVNKTYDLILLDMCMPAYSGVDFLIDLKARRPSELPKVVIVSALEISAFQEQELLNLGIRSILEKTHFCSDLIVSNRTRSSFQLIPQLILFFGIILKNGASFSFHGSFLTHSNFL